MHFRSLNKLILMNLQGIFLFYFPTFYSVIVQPLIALLIRSKKMRRSHLRDVIISWTLHRKKKIKISHVSATGEWKATLSRMRSGPTAHGWLKRSDLTLSDFSFAAPVHVKQMSPLWQRNSSKFAQTRSTILRSQQLPLGKVVFFLPTLGKTLHNPERPLTLWELVSLTLRERAGRCLKR